MKRDLFKIFIDESFSKPPKKIYKTNKKVYNHIDGIWSFDLADMVGYKISNNKGYRFIFIIFDSFSNHVWCIPLKNKNGETITKEFSKILTTSRRRPLKLESGRGSDCYNSIFQKFLQSKNFRLFSRFTDRGPSVVERVIRTIRSLIKKPVFESGIADWLSELPSVNKQYDSTIQHSNKMTPIEASKKSNEKEVYQNLQGMRVKQRTKLKLGQLFRTPEK